MITAVLAFFVVVATIAHPSQPRLIAKGDTYFVHIIPPTNSTKDQPGRGMSVTHTRRDTGAMMILAEGDSRSPYIGHTSSIEAWTSRGIFGTRTDGERLYVLSTIWEFRASPGAGVTRDRMTAELRVFWLADGSMVGTWPVEGVRPPPAWPVLSGSSPTTDAGLLKADIDGVSVRGQSFRFKGKALIDRVVESPLSPVDPQGIAAQPGYAIHAIGRLPATAAENEFAAVGTSIVYISLPSVKSRVLLQTGNREYRPEPTPEQKAAGVVPRPSVTQTRVVSAAVDAERLYVLVWHSEWQLLGPGNFVGPLLGNSDDYRLYTFWLADGSDLPPVKVTGGKKEVPTESVRNDHLVFVPGGVKVFGETVLFKGKNLVK